MGLLDKAFSLPKLSGSANVSDQLVSYAVAPTSTLINESFSAVTSRFGGVGSFNSLNVGAPSFAQLGASFSLGAIGQASSYFGAASSLTTGVSTSSATASQINEATGGQAVAGNTDHMVKLVSMINREEVVAFEVMPEVTESRQAEYEPLAASQMPGEFQKYKGTKSTSWQINATLTCRTKNEAFFNLKSLGLLRSWVMPFFGENQRGLRLGAPPPVLEFSGWRGLVGAVPVVITQVNWTWPKDCDWIPTGDTDDNGREIPFPTVMNLQISVVESFSAEQFNNFDLEMFRAGRMIDAYGEQVTSSQSAIDEPEVLGGNQMVIGGIPMPNGVEKIAEVLNSTPVNIKKLFG